MKSLDLLLSTLRHLLRWLASMAVVLVPLFLDSCSSTPKFDGLPSHLPNIALNGSPATPAHTMQSFEYPFDSGGNYVSDWAAEGERRSGRSAEFSRDDEEKWGGSHGGRVTGEHKPAKKNTTTSKASAKKSSKKDDDEPPKKKPGSSTAKKPSAGGKYTVKGSDTLFGIARKFGVSVERLKKANGLKSDTIRDGMTLTIPK